MSGFEVSSGYVPGALGQVASLHGAYYHDHWGFDLFFEAKVANELSDFLKAYEPDRDGFWTVSLDGRVEGAIAIDGTLAEKEGAHLRWFIVSDALRGNGAGDRLIQTALAFCRSCRYHKVFLWTFEGLDAAKHLY